MKKLIVVLIVLACGYTFSDAAVLDFEDLTVGAVVGFGDTLVTKDVAMTGQEFFWVPSGSTLSGSATVKANGDAGATGNELWFSNLNLSFDFEPDVYGDHISGLALQYGDHGGNVNLEINGQRKVTGDFIDLHNTIIGGATVTVVTNVILPTGPRLGAVFVVGTIYSFSIGGQELAVGNIITSSTPEPAAIGLLSIGGLALLRRKKIA